MRLILCLFSITLLPLCLLFQATNADSHGTVGGYTFLEPMVAEDANPKNEIVIGSPRWFRTAEGREFSLGFSVEKMLSRSLSIAAESEWMNLSPKKEDTVSGFNNLDLLLKYAFLTVPEHQLRFSIGAAIELPTGNPAAGAETHARLGPELLWAKGFGDLPNGPLLKWFRPLGIQGDFVYLPRIEGPTSHEMVADMVVEYSLAYLNNSVHDFGLRWPLRNLYLFTEFNYDQEITGAAGSTFPDLRITPGIAYRDNYVQLSVATQFPLNGATVPETHAAVLGLIDVFIDHVVPQTGWTPF